MSSSDTPSRTNDATWNTLWEQAKGTISDMIAQRRARQRQKRLEKLERTNAVLETLGPMTCSAPTACDALYRLLHDRNVRPRDIHGQELNELTIGGHELVELVEHRLLQEDPSSTVYFDGRDWPAKDFTAALWVELVYNFGNSGCSGRTPIPSMIVRTMTLLGFTLEEACESIPTCEHMKRLNQRIYNPSVMTVQVIPTLPQANSMTTGQSTVNRNVSTIQLSDWQFHSARQVTPSPTDSQTTLLQEDGAM